MYNIKEIQLEEIEKFTENLEKVEKKYINFHKKKILTKFKSIERELRLNKTQTKKLDLIQEKLKEEWGLYFKYKKKENQYLVYVFGKIYSNDMGIDNDKEKVIKYFEGKGENYLHVSKYDTKDLSDIQRRMRRNRDNLGDVLHLSEKYNEIFYILSEMVEEMIPILNSLSIPRIRKMSNEGLLDHFNTSEFLIEVGE